MARTSATVRPASAPIQTTKEPAVVTGRPRVFKRPEPTFESTPRRIRITQKGWENFNGDFGQVIFANGVSIGLATRVQYDRVATQVHVVDADTGEQIGPGQRHLEAKTARIPEGVLLSKPGQGDLLTAAAPPVNDIRLLTREQLYGVADAKGIQGLREIADPLGVKARAIPELINAIVRAQATYAANKAGQASPEHDAASESDVIDTTAEENAQ